MNWFEEFQEQVLFKQICQLTKKIVTTFSPHQIGDIFLLFVISNVLEEVMEGEVAYNV